MHEISASRCLRHSNPPPASERSRTSVLCNHRLRSTRDKPTKAALIATARKLLVTLNAMLATGTDYTVPATD